MPDTADLAHGGNDRDYGDTPSFRISCGSHSRLAGGRRVLVVPTARRDAAGPTEEIGITVTRPPLPNSCGSHCRFADGSRALVAAMAGATQLDRQKKSVKTGVTIVA